MDCATAQRLRNIGLVSISRELRVRAKRRASGTKPEGASAAEGLKSLQQRTDSDRKALQDHVTSCRQCQGAKPEDV
jgi:hypothetical protein